CIYISIDTYNLTPDFPQDLTLNDHTRLSIAHHDHTHHKNEHATICLKHTPSATPDEDHDKIGATNAIADYISDFTSAEASLYCQRGPELLRSIAPSQRAAYLELSTRVARRIGRQSYALFADGTAALREVDPARHKRLIELGERLVAVSPTAAMSFIKSA